jgi:hypothetical protein
VLAADRRTLGALVLAEGTEPDAGDAAAEARPTRVGVVAWPSEGRAGPTTTDTLLPALRAPSQLSSSRVAREPESGEWLMAYRPEPSPGRSEVLLWHGGRAERVGAGEAFEAADLTCAAGYCALLTTHQGGIATLDSELRIGRPGESVATWREVSIEPDADGKPVPIRIARLEPTPGGGPPTALVALEDGEELRFVRIDATGEPKPVGTLPVPHGTLDAMGLPTPAALSLRGPTEDRCRGGAGGVSFQQLGGPLLELPAALTPYGGTLHALEGGTFVAFDVPLTCLASSPMLYVALLPQGATTAEPPVAVARADAYALATSGTDLDLWIRQQGVVTWVRARCALAGPSGQY